MTDMPGDNAADCFVCRKHRDRGPLIPGGPVAEDELFLVSHGVTADALGRDGETAYLGHLFVEPRRHAPGMADLTDAEARSMGWWCTRASRALREVAGAEHVYAFVLEHDRGPGQIAPQPAPMYPGYSPRESFLLDSRGRLRRTLEHRVLFASAEVEGLVQWSARVPRRRSWGRRGHGSDTAFPGPGAMAEPVGLAGTAELGAARLRCRHGAGPGRSHATVIGGRGTPWRRVNAHTCHVGLTGTYLRTSLNCAGMVSAEQTFPRLIASLRCSDQRSTAGRARQRAVRA